MNHLRATLCAASLAIATAGAFHPADAQMPLGQLDPARNAPATSQPHTPLPEEYIWTAGAEGDAHVAPRYFRAKFSVPSTPPAATLYLAGVRSAKIWMNGELVAHFDADLDAPIGFCVFRSDVAKFLKQGSNTLAIEALRGHGVIAGVGSAATKQMSIGDALVAKIVPASFGAEAAALLISDAQWKSSTSNADGWETPGFSDAAWKQASSLGPIESNIDFFQWSADAGMYAWPGYMGMSPWLRTLEARPSAVTHVFEGQAVMSDPKALVNDGGVMTLQHFTASTDLESPAMLLDYGREIAGRIIVHNESACEVTLSVAYGEDELEALATGLTPTQRGANYLGTNLLHVPANGVARGPKSGFRYARVRVLRGCETVKLSAINAEAIYYPVEYKGSFDSSDPLLNRLWEAGAYTARLCMQDDIWDAPKRDRGRWAGDLDVEAHTILTAFGDTFLLEDTLDHLAQSAPRGTWVNGIPAYSPQWIAALADVYQYSGDKRMLARLAQHLRDVLATMDAQVAADGKLKPFTKGWGFVDWAPNLYGNTPDTDRGTALEFARAYALASPMLRDLADEAAATATAERAKRIFAATYADGFGSTWQVNTMGILTAPDAATAKTIAKTALSELHQDQPTDQQISPYFSAYLLEALSRAGHDDQALAWIRTYFGGMIAEGATSLWESYDLRWAKTNPHLSLQADGTSGYFVSLAHGWSSGPTAWMNSHVLGIEATSPGFITVAIHPDLLDLKFAKGTVPSPAGIIGVDLEPTKWVITIPPGVHRATVKTPAGAAVTLNGTAANVDEAGNVILTRPGIYTFRWH